MNTQGIPVVIARVLLALMFVLAGIGKLGGLEGTAGYIASKGLPMPQVHAALTILVELGGGVLLVLGWKARWAALAIAGFTVLASFLFHNYWTYAAPERMAQYLNFWKNIAIVGGLLMVFALGPGRYSVDRG